MNHKKQKQPRRFALGTAVGFFVFVQFFGLLLIPRPVHAQLATAEISSLPNEIDKVLETIGETLYASALGALVQGASYFMRQLAFDTASYIASGGKGQGALAFQEGPGPYFEKLGADTAAEAIDQLGKGFGLSLCSPPDLDFTVGLKVGLSRIYGAGGGPEPNCSWQELSQNWEAGADNDFGLASAANFADSLSVGQSDFGVALGALAKIDNLRTEAKLAGQIERLVGRDFKPVTDLISGQVRTPASVIEEETKALTGSKQSDRTLDQINGIYGAGAAQILPMAASIFLNTLTSQLLDQVLQEGIFPRNAGGSSGGSALDFFASTLVDNRQATQKAFNFFFTAVPTKSENVYDIIAEFSSCPQNPGLNNCVIDADFRQILQRANIGSPMTVQEALDEGLLHANWPLISPRRVADNTDIENCYGNKYCYSNLQKLRKVRILPLGFEVAALRSDPDSPLTLGQVVAGFEDCTRNAEGNVIPDSSKPFCHLIDPNWIIRSPEAKCEARVFGPELLSSNVPQRREECVDVSTCVTEGPNGECLDNYYSYCTKEKNVWRFGDSVASCEPQFATCTTYTGGDGSIASYLSRTLDFGECRADSVGCRAYSTEQANGEWVASGSVDTSFDYARAGRTQVVYFNDNINLQSAGCPAGAEGCTGFYIAEQNDAGVYESTDALIHLKKAPAYLGCYDTNPSTIETDWPETVQQINNLLPGGEACGNFANVCVEEEVGCQGYMPALGDGPEVPGVVGNNICAAECVGYDAFQQEASSFDPQDYPLYFIPNRALDNMASAGQVCSEQYAGCSEFTNLDTTQAGGEGLEYYTSIKYCEDPIEENGQVTNRETYYTWEGSASEGFVLRVHELKPVDEPDALYLSALNLEYEDGDAFATVFPVGSPMYADDSAEQIQSYYDVCNAATYEASIQNPAENIGVPDCRAFYDNTNTVTYRLLSKTITVDDACHPLRKTESNLFVDGAITDATLCADKGGLYEGGSCQRCYGGGEYVEVDGQGSCVYYAITEENQSTSCIPQANGCRAYTGNAGGNVFSVFLDTFEPTDASDQDALNQAKAGWPASATIVAESTIVSQYSLQSTQSSVARQIDAEDLENGAWYELTFWARGTSGNLRIALEQNGTRWEFTEDAATEQEALLSIGDTWRQYNVGPVQFTGDAGVPTSIVFERTAAGAGGPYFLDNVELTRVQDHIYLIKDSWKEFVLNENNEFVEADVPLACDSTPQDAFPGEALGCRSYVDRNSQTVNATGFDQLCREEAIGCTPVLDTYNTVNVNDPELLHAYNVKCTVPGGDTVVAETICSIAGVEEWSCAVAPGKNSCYVDDVTAADVDALEGYENASIDEATVIVPADTPETEPVFLTNTPASQCSSQYRGCLRVGSEEQTLPGDDAASYEHNDTFVLNNPERYAGDTGILCRPDLVGCDAFQAGNTTAYFKDPRQTGGQLCEYKDALETPAGTLSGWFMNGVGRCGGTDAGALCRTDNDCSEGVACEDVGTVACYPDYFTSGGEYGLWSNGAPGYEGFVGTCPIDQNACTELVDPADTTGANPDGKPYYVIFDDQVQSRVQLCNGQVGLEEGCVLFDRTAVPNKLYDTAQSYEASRAERETGADGLVDPVSSNANNANIILKVDRDRECSEWLACRTALPQQNARGGTDNICYEFRACNETDGTDCTNWVARDVAEDTFLSYEAYVTRDTSWYGEEYTGYSFFDKFQVNNYTYVTIDNDPNPDASYVAYRVPQSLFDAAGADGFDASCETDGGFEDDWSACGFDGGGRCLNAECVYPINGTFPPNATADNIAAGIAALGGGGLCKAFPEPTSPFPRSIVTDPSAPAPNDSVTERQDFIERKQLFSGANVCQDGNCSCEYVKVGYENGVTDYWSQRFVNNNPYGIPQPGICVGGKSPGDSCTKETEAAACGEGGTCSIINKKETHLGLRGYCLEYDRSRPINGNPDEFACLTWLPIDVSASNVDNFNLDSKAGFDPSEDAALAGAGAFGGMYCVDSTETGFPRDDNEWKSEVISSGVRQMFSSSPNQNFISHCYIQAMLGGTDEPSDSCGGFSPSPNDPGTGNFYTILQSWLHDLNDPVVKGGTRTFGPNALVLRAEQSMTTASKFGDYNETHSEEIDYGTQNAVPSRANVKQVIPYNFLPRVRSLGTPVPAGECGDRCNGIGSGFETIGVAHHPPREWTPTEYSGAVGVGNHFHDPIGVGANISAQDGWGVSGIALAPGPYYSIDNMDSALYRSPFEASMTEADLDKVFFVPTAYPGGQQEQNPVWLDDRIYIDFTALWQTGGGAIGRATNMYISSAEEDGDDLADDINNDDKGGDLCAEAIPFVDPQCAQKANGAQVLTYMLNNDDHSNLISQYPGLQTPMVEPERNTIQKRYVLVWYEKSKEDNPQLSWVQDVDSDTKIPTTDPFSTEIVCDESLNSKWFVIAMDFNAEGEFLGYVSRWCSANRADHDDNSQDDVTENGVNMAVVATLNNTCTEYHLVQNETSTKDTNKAWTNRLWSGSLHQPPEYPINRTWPIVPYASTDLDASPFDQITRQNILRLRGYTFPKSSTSGEYPLGRPYACSAPLREGFDTGLASGLFEATCPGLTASVQFAVDDILRELFAKSYNIAKRRSEWSGNVEEWLENSSFGGEVDAADTVGQDLLPPQIYSLNPATCFGDGNCTAGEANNITVNGKNGTLTDYNGDDVPDEDANFNDIPDAIIAKGSLAGVVQFFAFADDNRMPISRIMVDWDDGSDILNQNKFGKYYNRKPFCEDSNNPSTPTVGHCGANSTSAPSLLTCETNSDCPADTGGQCVLANGGEGTIAAPTGVVQGAEDRDRFDLPRFGDLPRACVEGYFEFQHGYSCDSVSENRFTVDTAPINDGDRERLNAQGLSGDSEICVFKPRVQVLDNWGFCNGSCTDPITGQVSTNGCYNDTSFQLCDNSAGAWTPYNGKIIIIP